MERSVPFELAAQSSAPAALQPVVNRSAVPSIVREGVPDALPVPQPIPAPGQHGGSLTVGKTVYPSWRETETALGASFPKGHERAVLHELFLQRRGFDDQQHLAQHVAANLPLTVGYWEDRVKARDPNQLQAIKTGKEKYWGTYNPKATRPPKLPADYIARARGLHGRLNQVRGAGRGRLEIFRAMRAEEAEKIVKFKRDGNLAKLDALLRSGETHEPGAILDVGKHLGGVRQAATYDSARYMVRFVLRPGAEHHMFDPRVMASQYQGDKLPFLADEAKVQHRAPLPEAGGGEGTLAGFLGLKSEGDRSVAPFSLSLAESHWSKLMFQTLLEDIHMFRFPGSKQPVEEKYQEAWHNSPEFQWAGPLGNAAEPKTTPTKPEPKAAQSAAAKLLLAHPTAPPVTRSSSSRKATMPSSSSIVTAPRPAERWDEEDEPPPSPPSPRPPTLENWDD